MSKYQIGLTGGIGSGKSSVAGFLRQLGVPVIDADCISRAATAADGIAVSAIEQAFGTSVITPERALDRAAMRDLVFKDRQAKQRLESIVHPIVRAQMYEQAQQAQGAYIVFDIPLLIENLSQYRDILNRICVVDCEEQTQIQRVSERSGLSVEMVQQIMRNQASREQRLQYADDVIFDGAQVDFSELQEQCYQQHLVWLNLARQHEGNKV